MDKEIENKVAVGEQINKEFVPIFLIIVTPMLAFLNGFGIKTASVGVDIFYVAALVFGVLMGRLERRKIVYKYEFFLLIILEIVVSVPYMKYDNYFNGNYVYLIISYALIVFFNIIIAYSFMINDPYFTGYYVSDKPAYIVIYRIVSGFFIVVALYQAYLFTRVLEILKLTFK